MEITLTPELEDLVNEKIRSGKYDSPSQVVRDGLRLLKEQDQLKQLRQEEMRREVMKGVEQMKNGQFTTYDSAAELAKEIIRRGKEKQICEASHTKNTLFSISRKNGIEIYRVLHGARDLEDLLENYFEGLEP